MNEIEASLPSALVKTELDRDMDTFVKQMQDEYSNFAESELKTEGAPPQSPENIGEVTPEPVKEEVKPTPTDDVVREVTAKLREERLTERESKVKEYEDRIRELESRQIPADLTEELRLRPTATLEGIGIDVDELVRVAIAEKMAKVKGSVPPELQSKIDANRTQAQIRALEGKLISQAREKAQREFYDKVDSDARDYLKGIKAETHPLLSEISKVDSSRAHKEIMQEIIDDARLRASREPNGQLLTYDEAAKRVETRWADYKRFLTPHVNTVPAPEAPPVSKAGTTPTTPKAGTPANTVRPPERPLAPWLKRIDIEEQGLKEALDEWRRVETASRKG